MEITNGWVFLHVSQLGLLKLDLLKMSFLWMIRRSRSPKVGYPRPSGLMKMWSINGYGCHATVDYVFDRATKQVWSRHFNQNKLAILNNERIQDGITTVYIDQKRRFWIVYWPNGVVVDNRFMPRQHRCYLPERRHHGHLGQARSGTLNSIIFTKPGIMDFGCVPASCLTTTGASKSLITSPVARNKSVSAETILPGYGRQGWQSLVCHRSGLFFTPVGTESYALVNLIFWK